MAGVLLKGGKGRVFTLKYMELMLNLDESELRSRITFCQETKHFQTDLHPFCTINLVRIHLHLQCRLYLQEVTHVTSGIRASADEQGSGWSVTSRRQSTRRNTPPADKSQEESKPGSRARLVSRHDKRRRLCENQRYQSDATTSLQFQISNFNI